MVAALPLNQYEYLTNSDSLANSTKCSNLSDMLAVPIVDGLSIHKYSKTIGPFGTDFLYRDVYIKTFTHWQKERISRRENEFFQIQF